MCVFPFICMAVLLYAVISPFNPKYRLGFRYHVTLVMVSVHLSLFLPKLQLFM